MHLFTQIPKALWAMHPPRFWMIWLTTSTGALIYVLHVVGREAGSAFQNAKVSSTRALPARQQIWDSKAITALAFLAVFVSLYIAMILAGVDFSYYDDDDFIFSTLRGHSFPPPIWHVNGRFFPFGLLEFNLIRHFVSSPLGYYIVPVAQILIVVYILLILDTEISIASRVGIAILCLLTPSILLSFSGLIFEERNVIVLLAGLILCVRRFEQYKAVGWAVGAMLCGQIML